jgi:penicillin-binding protein 1C
MKRIRALVMLLLSRARTALATTGPARLRIVVGACCAILAVPLTFAAWIAWPLPAELRTAQPVTSVTLLDRNGMPLRTTRSPDGVRGGWLEIERIDPDLIRAFLAAEDQRFHQHGGIDTRALARALYDNAVQWRVVSGASTITMQTARLLRGTDRSWSGKVAQALWALRLEAHLDKNQILERYLNLVPLGQGTVGVAAAAALYFDASAADLSVGQAATLAGVARTPARDNALASAAKAEARRALVLQRMVEAGHIGEDEAAAARTEPVLRAWSQGRFHAPHFTTRVLGRMPAAATGAHRTTIDLDLQLALEAEARHAAATLKDRAAAHAALVVLDNVTGDVLAWVGSPDFFGDSDGQVDMVSSRRQPGSTLKPFLFGLAFDRGFTAASVLPDVPRTYATAGGPYSPQNYDRRFRGPVRAREALASSYNVPAVELVERLGTGALLRTLHEAGFASLSRSAEHYGLGLALGNGDVSLIELANAYRGIANGGVWRPYHTLADSVQPQAERRFMSRSSAAIVLDILSDPLARMPGFGSETPLDFPFRTAAKTGTSRHYSDNWAVATTARFTVAVWVGNFNGRPMQRVSGISGAGPLLHRAVLETARRYAPGTLVDPETAGLAPAAVCMLSGMRATSACASLIEWFAPGTEPQQPDTWQEGGRIALPAEYAEWYGNGTVTHHATVASGGLARHERPRILSPAEGDAFERPHDVDPRYASIRFVASNDGGVVKWTVNGRPVSGRWRLEAGEHVVAARWPDGARDSVRISVRPTGAGSRE